MIKSLSADKVTVVELAGDKIEKILTSAPGNDAPIGGIKIETKNGWIAARPSGTEDIYKVYAESFLNPKHLDQLIEDGEKVVRQLISSDCRGASK